MKARAENGKFTNKFKQKRLKNLLNSNINDYGFLEGRRVVEFQVMIEGLKKCYECENELSLTNIKSETKYGLGSLLHIECAWCSADNAVPTGKRHKTNNHQTGTRCFDINTKLAAAMINAGIGEHQMNNILAFMNLPTVNKGTLKTREREIGQSIDTVAVQSCSRAVKEEILSSEEKDEKWVEVSADGGWQRRGTGHSNNSMSGHVTIVGKTSRKCLSFAVAKKNCRFCRIAKRRKVTVTKHKCRKNWSGSSKAIEPFLTLKCLQDLKGNGLDVNALTMDDDTSTFTRAKRCLFPSLRKNSDKNHVVKNMTNSLYNVKANNKKLSNETITYVKKCFSYAVSQNQGDPEGIKRNLNAIVPHSYGEHGGCDRKWCRADEANYRHSSLPGGRNLTDPAIRKDLEEVITPYISEKFTEKLASISTTNPNENLNMIISRKAPKGSHFSESDSLDIRVSAAIAQKNEGHAYILEVNDSHCLTPGHFTKKRCEILDKKRHYYATQKQTVKQKRRRIELKNHDPTPEESGDKKFFGGKGPPMFSSFQRRSQGHVNPAYQQDDEQDTDDNLSHPECQSSAENSDTEGEMTHDDSSQRISEDYSTEKEPVGNGHIANGGKDFKVGFGDIEEKSRPPPESEPHQRRSKKKIPKSWDKFIVTSKDNVSNSDIRFWDKVFVVTKLVMCFVLFVLTLGTAVITKLCFLIITANIYPSGKEKENYKLKTLYGLLNYKPPNTNVQWIWALIMMAGAPYFFTAIKCLWRLLFQMAGRGTPTFTVIFAVLGIETIHSVGLNIMMFIIIPNLDPLSGLMMTLCVGVVPAWLKIFYPTVGPTTKISEDDRNKPTLLRSTIITVVSVIGACGQLGAIGLWVYHVYKSHSQFEIPYIVCMILAPIFTSVYWWENYIYEGKKDSSGVPLLARHMRKCRTKLTLYASVWKTIITIIIPLAVFGINCYGQKTDCIHTLFFKTEKSRLSTGIEIVDLISTKDLNGCYSNNYLPLIIAAIGALCSGVCFKVAKVACKIMTQIVDYSLPLMLSTPATFGIIIGFYYKFKPTDCSVPFPTWVDGFGFQNLISLDTDNIFQRFNFIAGICGFFSLLLVTNHIWTPGKERLQTTDRLFVKPLYCGIFFDQSMMLNRRRIEKAKSADTVKHKVTKIPLPDEIKDDDKGDRSIFRTTETPMIYLCATMWHESENEMTQLLKSIFRMDEDQCTRKFAQFLVGRRDPDYYEFEAHIFFDDAFEGHKDDEYNFTVNEYVKLLLKTVKVSASSVHGVSYNINPPVKIATPYGGRLVWTLPGGNKLIAHLKDKAFIRHRKRWSQVMYMYYFLGYELFNKNLKRRQLQKRAENTFLLALDGDVDFHPQAVQLLVDRMRKNKDVGAACGRIHPIGNGAMVWYQKFEYAVSHWLQKAAEDKFGCVLCSPGCFSLFRGSSLMDENVMAKYTTPPTEPRHYVQYDQGEDRWLCTLLLQQGHRVEYCAASDALTYAPEGFYEFFNQRRRWTPSTMANILDLLTDWKNVTKKNAEITIAYVFYQALLMVSSILTPGTIFLMILGAINLAYPEVKLWVALVINALPVAIMVFLCFKAKSDTQLTYAAILSTAYSLIMMIVIVGLLRQAAMYGMCSVTTVFLLFVAGVFVLAAFLHPQEFWCIIHGFLYFLAIPSMSMILMIYALGNLHVVSWGTRENKTAAEQQADKKDSKVSGFLSMFSGCCPWGSIVTQREDDKLRVILDRLDGVESGLRDLSTLGSNRSFGNSLSVRSGSPVVMGNEEPAITFTDMEHMFSGASNKANPIFDEEKQQPRDRLVNPYWCEEDSDIRLLKQESISTDETQFWRELIEEYLKPLDADKNKEKEIQAQLIELRNKVCLIFILINSLFIIIVFSLQQVVSSGDGNLSIKLPCPNSESNSDNKGDNIEPISVAFTLVFGILLFVQFICMLMHRMATLLHICASTEIFKKKRKIQMPGMSSEEGAVAEEPAAKAEMSYEQVYELVRDMQKDQDADTASLTSESSFGGQSEADEDEAAENRRKTQRERWKKLARQRRRINNRTLGANFMKNLERIQSVMRDSNRPEGDGENETTEEDEIKAWKKKTHFNRMRNKSIHVIAMMAKDPKMKENISKKQIIKEKKTDVVRKMWHTVGVKALVLQPGADGVDGKPTKKTSMTNITDVLLANKRENDARKALQDVIEAESPALSRRNVDVHAEDTEQNDDDMYAKVNDVRDELDSDKESNSPKESESEDEEEHGATFHLEIPKVEDDQWPDEENYAQVQDKIDVLF